MMESADSEFFPDNGTAVVIGASGGIGAAVRSLLEDHSGDVAVISLSRGSDPSMD